MRGAAAGGGGRYALGEARGAPGISGAPRKAHSGRGAWRRPLGAGTRRASVTAGRGSEQRPRGRISRMPTRLGGMCRAPSSAADRCSGWRRPASAAAAVMKVRGRPPLPLTPTAQPPPTAPSGFNLGVREAGALKHVPTSKPTRQFWVFPRPACLLVFAVTGTPLTMSCAHLSVQRVVCWRGARTLVGVRSPGHLPGPTGLGVEGRATSAILTWRWLAAAPHVGESFRRVGCLLFSQFSDSSYLPEGDKG